ncbi:MAG: hypothetical protein FJ271_10310 [Planctomycetes bacterium]|nr:hypothetical protein [Planctomycetota bacterium]
MRCHFLIHRSRLLIIPLMGMVLSVARADTPPVKAAIDKGLRRIEQGAASYRSKRTCFSCHHQALPLMSLTLARERGFSVRPAEIQEIVDFTLKSFARRETIAKGQGVGGANTTVAYALATLSAAGHRPDATTAALVKFLTARQRGDGAWPAQANRPPSEGSLFASAAFALANLRRYADDDQKQQVEETFRKGKAWLLANPAKTTEDKVFRLHALVHAGADVKNVDVERERLLGEQRGDGSWAQLPGLAGDAYATGSAIFVLRHSGVPADHPAFRKAVKFLVSTQKEDGSWFVKTRSRPIQTFFDNGDPGGPSQFISFTATSWAVIALLETLEKKRVK